MNSKKIIDVVLAVAVIWVGVFFYKLVSDNKKLENSVKEQEYRASVLMEEVGQAKQDNTLIFQKLLETQRVLDEFKPIENEVNITTDGIVEPVLPNLSLVADQTNEPKKIPRVAAPIINSNTKNYLIVGQNSHLADSIIIAAVNEQTQGITLISIPRDTYVNGRKINEYLSLFGIETFKEKVSVVTALNIDGYATVDFGGFEKIIDSLGGIDINVQTAIYDSQYPDGKGSYTVYSISEGAHHLSGEEALKYARSRHSTSDFDRARRQQQIIKALKERLLNFDFLNNLDVVKSVYESILDSFETDLSFIDLINYLAKYREYSIKNTEVFSTANFLYSTSNVAGQYILLPRSGDFTEMQKYINELLL